MKQLIEPKTSQLDLDSYVKGIVLLNLAPTTENENDTRRESQSKSKTHIKQG